MRLTNLQRTRMIQLFETFKKEWSEPMDKSATRIDECIALVNKNQMTDSQFLKVFSRYQECERVTG